MRLNKTRARKNSEEWTIIMASDFWLIAGLGNPGSKYEGTRHNMGFMTADVLAERWSVNFSDHKGLAMLGKGVMNLSGRNVKFFLAKPLTYMNESGNAVASISAYYQIEPDHIVVIHDDMDLDFGRIKVKAGGSAGGHNGIKSIDRSLGTPKYARVRMGVGHAQRGAHAHDNTVNWVLGGFGPDQRKHLRRSRQSPGAIQWPLNRRLRRNHRNCRPQARLPASSTCWKPMTISARSSPGKSKNRNQTSTPASPSVCRTAYARRSQPALRANSRSCSSSPPAAKRRKPWSPSVPGMTETQTMWRSLKHGRPFPMNGFHHARTLWQAAWRCSAG